MYIDDNELFSPFSAKTDLQELYFLGDGAPESSIYLCISFRTGLVCTG